jgi:thymidine kinase
MFSGKSTLLLERARELRARGLSVALVKPALDDRYTGGVGGEKDVLVTHAGARAQCVRVARLGDLPARLGPERWAALDAVCVDEGQFFEDLVEFSEAAAAAAGGEVEEEEEEIVEEKEGEEEERAAPRQPAATAAAAAFRPKRVVIAALSGDYRRRPFGRVAELLPLADRVRALRASCFSCGAPAPFSVRLRGEDDAQVLVGGPEAYRPACRACFFASCHAAAGRRRRGGDGAAAALP